MVLLKKKEKRIRISSDPIFIHSSILFEEENLCNVICRVVTNGDLVVNSISVVWTTLALL